MNVAPKSSGARPLASTRDGERLGRVKQAAEAWAAVADLATPEGVLKVVIRQVHDGIDVDLVAASGARCGSWFPASLGAQPGLAIAEAIERDMRPRRITLGGRP